MAHIETHHGHEAALLRDAQIMIVDDKESNVRLLEGILKGVGYTRLVSTTSPREALSIATVSLPDMVLLDLMMPEINGFQVMEQLKLLIPEEEFLPILVLTADVSQETRRRALTVGATDFLTKPLDSIEVLLRIQNLLHTRFLHQALQQQNRLLEGEVQKRTDELTQMLHQLVNAQETERRHISMEIHDGPLQSLGVCTLAVDRIMRRHERGEHDLVLSEARELRFSLNSTIEDLRSVLAELSLEILSSHGLAPALRDYVAWLSDLTEIDVTVSLDEAATARLSPQVQLLMYRLAQEALSNVRKHAHASMVELVLKVEREDLYMVITDNGKGFNVDPVLRKLRIGEHIGLRSMRERIQKAQGEMRIDSVPGKGTSLKFRCPSGADRHKEESL